MEKCNDDNDLMCRHHGSLLQFAVKNTSSVNNRSNIHLFMQDVRSNSLKKATLTKASSSRSIVLALITLAQFMVVVDFTIVQVALPSIGKEFGMTVNNLQWIVTSYGLTLAGFLMLSGRVGDVYGHKKLLITGLLLFSLASLTGGHAPSEIVLILARVGQGLGASDGFCDRTINSHRTFSEGKERNRALSVFSAATGSGFAAGMILGGIMTSTLGWRWVFDINVPIGVVVSLLSLKYVSNSTGQTYKNRGHHLDIFGAISVTAGLILLVYSLNSAQNIGIESHQTLELLLLSAIVLAAFLVIEYRSKAPLCRFNFYAEAQYLEQIFFRLASVSSIRGNGIYSNELSSAGSWLLCSFSWPCVCPNGGCISSCFGSFVSAICKSIRCQTNFSFGDDFADNRLPITFTVPSHRKPLWRSARTNAHHRSWNWIRLHGNQHSRAYGNEERGRRTRFRID